MATATPTPTTTQQQQPIISLPPWTTERGPIVARWTLAALMAARCISIGELARSSGVSRQAITRARCGRGTTAMPTRRALARALGVEPDSIRWGVLS
jgi:hypothetical protein